MPVRLFTDRDEALRAEHDPDLLGGVTVVRGTARARRRPEPDGPVETYAVPVRAVPYYAWDHRGAGEMAVLMAALLGGAIGFLWFNAAPAMVFMGDVGSLGLGGALAYAALVSRTELVLLVVGGVFVAEAVSVILQVGSFKLRGKRVFRCAPLHHHFQFGGMPETRVVARTWIVSALLAMCSLVLFKVR